MLTFLHIRNYAIIDSLDLDLGSGFTCITGETGAGKSILVGALGLLTGQRADTSAVRQGCEKAELSAEFQVREGSPAEAWLREAELLDGKQCLLRRMISEKGRSRAWINGTVVTLQQLSELGERLVEIHGQNEHLRLLRPVEQFRLLDGALENSDVLPRLHTAFTQWQELDAERTALLEETPLAAGDIELLQFHVREMEEVLPDAQQFSELEAEHRLLARSGEVGDTLNFALAAFDQGRGQDQGQHQGLSAGLGQLLSQLEPVAELDEGIASALSLLREAQINCDEARQAIGEAQARLDDNPQRLQELEQRLGQLHDLARKHRTQPELLEQALEQLSARLHRAGERDQRLQEIDQALESALQNYREAAQALSEQRTVAADTLSKNVTGLMNELGFKGGEFVIRVSYDKDTTPSARGGDSLEFLVSANPGSPPAPLKKVASGGELSRISLAIKVASQSAGRLTTQVFDEVDAGIGGETARSVGALIRSLSVSGQCLCVTHLAQVAVFADRQLQVSKSAQREETQVNTSLLGPDQRIDEIARMLGGQLSDQSRAHATELLDSAIVKH